MDAHQTTDSQTAPVDAEHARHLLRQMLRIQRLEERAAELYTQENIRGFLHLYIGEEMVAVGVMEVAQPADAIVGGGLPLAVGLAMAKTMQDRDGIAICFFGEGAIADGRAIRAGRRLIKFVTPTRPTSHTRASVTRKRQLSPVPQMDV